MRDQHRGTGRTTRTLEAALQRMLNEGQNVMVLINHPREFDNMVHLVTEKIGIIPSVVNRSRLFMEIAGHKMYFVASDFPDSARGFKVDNIFTDHHFYEGLCWQDWQWLFAQQRR